MIEDGLFLGLGFCIATLIAIACLPVIWTRALRRTHERLLRLVPSSQAEVDAVYDGLRAKAAVAERRLEQRMEAERRAAAEVKVDLGRRTVSLISAEKAAEALRGEHSTLRGEFDEHLRDWRDGEAQRAALEKALHDADTQAEAALSAATKSADLLDRSASLNAQQRAAIAALETRAAGLQAEVADGRDRVLALESVAAQHAKAELAVEAAFELKRNEAERLKTSLATLQQALEQERRLSEDRERRMAQQSEVLGKAETRMAELDALIKQRQAELAAFKLRIEALEAELKARSDRQPADPRTDDQDDALLRDAISAIGDDALRLLKPTEERGPAASGHAARVDTVQP